MKKNIIYVFLFSLIFCFSCQNNDYDISETTLGALSDDVVSGSLVGDDYVWNWSLPSDTLSMHIDTYSAGGKVNSTTVSGKSFTWSNVDTNIDYTFVFKLTDGTNYSKGLVKHYTRAGATKISGLSMSQTDKEGGMYDAEVTWPKALDATSLKLIATNGTKTINEILSGTTTSYTISDVKVGDTWNVSLTAVNATGSSLPVISSLKIGKTTVGYLGIYPTVADLISKGDDDEIAAWKWLTANYPTAEYVYFGAIKSESDVTRFRVLWWMRDIETGIESEVWNIPSVATSGATLASLKQWYKDGGNFLLWSHAVPYIMTLGRFDSYPVALNKSTFCGCGAGGINNDTWSISVEQNCNGTKYDHSSHPLFKNMSVTDNGTTKLIAFKGPGWTCDHNCGFFDFPSSLTGYGNQDPACYASITSKYGIYPLATWDSQCSWISQLNIWECQQGDTEYQGTVICIGNGGCEFVLKNADGTPNTDWKNPNNIYQNNILQLAKNSIEYLKTR